ncbi:MAG: citrate synthase [Acidimicrobiales bacterium]
MSSERRLSTAEAAARLGVKPETLYAYVSRGLIRRERSPHGSTFAPTDVERLAQAGRRVRRLPTLVFPSSLTLIENDRVFYRGLDVIRLSRERTFEEVAGWLWTGSWPDATEWPNDTARGEAVGRAQETLPNDCLPIDRLRLTVAVAAGNDPNRHDTTPTAVISTAQRLIPLMVQTVAPTRSARRPHRRNADLSIAAILWPKLSPLPPTTGRIDALNAALVLLADHELAVSTLAVRAAAMARADTYGVVGTGLNVAGGSRHGGASLDLEGVLSHAAVVGIGRAIEARLANGHLPGFGHPIYKNRDPRARPLLDRLNDLDPDPARRAFVDSFLDAVESRSLFHANVDAALAGLAWCGEMRPGSGEAIFVIARTAGWVAHALEQYDQTTLMRSRVDYAGPRPNRTTAK